MDRSNSRKSAALPDAAPRPRQTAGKPDRAPTRAALAGEKHRWSVWLKALSVALLAGVIFSPALPGEFLWDDTTQIVENETLRTADGLGQIWSDPGSQMQYYPLTYTTYWLEYQIWKQNPTGYHIVNILLHLANAVLAFFVLRALALPGAWLAAALFAVHPLQTESVAWIAERKNVLASLFYLAAVLLWLRFGQTRHWASYAGALVCFAGALLSKTAVVTLPVVLALLEWWRPRYGWKRAALLLAPFFVLAVIFGLLTIGVESQYYAGGKSGREFSPLDSLLIATRALWFYLYKLAWPTDLLAIYPQWTIDPKAAWQYLFPLGVAAVAALLWLQRRRWGRGPLFAALFFAVTLGPTLGFLDFGFLGYSYVADRFQYLACLGPFALFAALTAGGTQRLASSRPTTSSAESRKIALQAAGAPADFNSSASERNHPPDGPDAPHSGPRFAQFISALATAGGAALVLSLAFLSWKQSGIYRDAVTFWTHNLAGNPTHIAYSALGDAYAKKNDWEQAETCQRRSVELKDNFRARSRLGEIYAQRLGELHKQWRQSRQTPEPSPNAAQPAEMEREIQLLRARALEELQRAAQLAQAEHAIRPLHARIVFNLGAFYWNFGGPDWAQCVNCWRQAQKIDPRLAGVQNWLLKAQQRLRAERGAPPRPD